jgi:hypothetical protein
MSELVNTCPFVVTSTVFKLGNIAFKQLLTVIFSWFDPRTMRHSGRDTCRLFLLISGVIGLLLISSAIRSLRFPTRILSLLPSCVHFLRYGLRSAVALCTPLGWLLVSITIVTFITVTGAGVTIISR